MLRITVHDEPASMTFQLEGGLAGNWVHELERCWQARFAVKPEHAIRFELTEVTFIDASGKAFLAARHAQGAELEASGCMMKAIVAEVCEITSRANRAK
jgi:hypothetical protein